MKNRNNKNGKDCNKDGNRKDKIELNMKNSNNKNGKDGNKDGKKAIKNNNYYTKNNTKINNHYHGNKNIKK